MIYSCHYLKSNNIKINTIKQFVDSAVDVDTHDVISTEATLINVGDSEALPTLLNPLRRRVHSVSVTVLMTRRSAMKYCRLRATSLLYLTEKMLVTGKRDTLEMKW